MYETLYLPTCASMDSDRSTGGGDRRRERTQEAPTGHAPHAYPVDGYARDCRAARPCGYSSTDGNRIGQVKGGRKVAETHSIYIIEDHPRMRRMLKRLIESASGFEIVGEAPSAEAALPLLDNLQPDLCLVDLSLPGMSGLDFIRKIQEQQPSLRCLVVTGHSDPIYRAAAIAVGAIGYVTKDDPDAVLDAVYDAFRTSGAPQ